VFAEHRFYGKTMPFGDHSMSLKELSYCTVEQALADYAKLIMWLKYQTLPYFPLSFSSLEDLTLSMMKSFQKYISGITK
jgi:hypothetical protein